MRPLIKKSACAAGKAAVPICFLLLVMLDTAFRYLYATAETLPVFSATAMTFTVLWALLMCGVIYCLPTMGRRIAIVLFAAFSCFACFVNAVMFNLFGNYFSFADIAYAGDGAKFFSFAYLKVRKALLICIVLALAAAVVSAVSLPKKKWRPKRLIVGVIIIALSVTGIALKHSSILAADTSEVFTWNNTHSSDSDAANYKSVSNVNRCLSFCGSYQYLFRSFAVTYHLGGEADYGKMRSELDEYYAAADKNEHQDNEMTGVFEGKNLILIMMESIDTWMLTEDCMPNLYKLQQCGISFSENYAPMFISAGTFNSEFIANTGLVPPSTGANVEVYAKNEFPYSAANLFKAEGYEANSFHSASPLIYNRGEIHKNLGFGSYNSYTQMGMENYMLDSQLLNGFELITEGEKFFSFIITYSGHGPYTEEMHEISDAHIEKAKELAAAHGIDADEKNLSEYTYALAHALETDEFIGGLTQRLEDSGLLEDTVVVLFTDHYSKYMTDHEFVNQLKSVNYEYEVYRTPFIIYSADVQPEEITKVSSTLDILPTLANMFGLDAPYRYYAGNDIFGSGGGYAPFPGNKWYDGEVYYNQNTGTEYTPEQENKAGLINRSVAMSMDTVRCSYFG